MTIVNEDESWMSENRQCSDDLHLDPSACQLCMAAFLATPTFDRLLLPFNSLEHHHHTTGIHPTSSVAKTVSRMYSSRAGDEAPRDVSSAKEEGRKYEPLSRARKS